MDTPAQHRIQAWKDPANRTERSTLSVRADALRGLLETFDEAINEAVNQAKLDAALGTGKTITISGIQDFSPDTYPYTDGDYSTPSSHVNDVDASAPMVEDYPTSTVADPNEEHPNG